MVRLSFCVMESFAGRYAAEKSPNSENVDGRD